MNFVRVARAIDIHVSKKINIIMSGTFNFIRTLRRVSFSAAKHRFKLPLLGIPFTPPHFLLEMPMAFYRKQVGSMSDRDGFSTGEC